MSHYYSTVLNYLEHYQPERFEVLKAERQLAAVVDSLVAQLYMETARELASVKRYHPDVSEAELLVTSERAAIASILPLTAAETSM